MKVSGITRSILFKWVPAAFVVASIAGCPNPMAVKDDVNSQFFDIRPGSQLILHQDVSIPSGRSHASFQHGKVVNGLDNYAVGCVLDVRDLGPGSVSAGTFTIKRAESSQEWVSRPNIMKFYRVMYLRSDSQPQVLRLTCQDWDGPLLGDDISVPEIREALGGIFSFEFAQ
ncbi:MAG: hypothetical protein KAJ65_07600 [Gammaproteobacteria bacterium]|nr:hypothetical protein [Gammaproteobacteria bacterium]